MRQVLTDCPKTVYETTVTSTKGSQADAPAARDNKDAWGGRPRHRSMWNVTRRVGTPTRFATCRNSLFERIAPTLRSVSYTHLTLPTICSV